MLQPQQQHLTGNLNMHFPTCGKNRDTKSDILTRYTDKKVFFLVNMGHTIETEQ